RIIINWYNHIYYIENNMNNVIILKLYIGNSIKTGNKTNFNVRVHNFSAAADIRSDESKHLGAEADLTFNYNFNKAINIKAGYSHMFAYEGMEIGRAHV